MNHYQAVIIGGGAAGIFAAIACAERGEGNVLVLEKTRQLLSKVKISGGGRCNATHHCFDPKELVRCYPRGSRELLGPFHRFQPKDTIAWFEERGVELKVEEDGRMFPTTDNSQTIIDCLMSAAKKAGVVIEIGYKVDQLKWQNDHWSILLATGEEIVSKNVMLATGSSPQGHELARHLGHSIVDPVPSLFTFNVPDSPLLPLAGVSVPDATVSFPQFKLSQRGPVLVTHWGFSGPAVLKLSAFGARFLHDVNYETQFFIDWLPEWSHEQLQQWMAQQDHKRSIDNDPISPIPKQLWKALVNEEKRWNELSKADIQRLCLKLKKDPYKISGKTTYKQEFVVCGGIKLSEVDFKTMESRIVPHLYFAGEILDIDGITGGFNFQAAWTCGYIAGCAMSL